MTTHFIVDRSKWRTGKNSENKTGIGTTYLLNDEGFMCCLGFCSLQLGVPKKNLLTAYNPATIKELLPEENYFLRDSTESDWVGLSDLSKFAISINDNPDTTVSEKEKQLTSLFNRQGLTIEFINEPTLCTNT